MSTEQPAERMSVERRKNLELRRDRAVEIINDPSESKVVGVWFYLQDINGALRELDAVEAERDRLASEVHEWEESDKAGPIFTELLDKTKAERDAAIAARDALLIALKQIHRLAIDAPCGDDGDYEAFVNICKIVEDQSNGAK